MVHKHILSDAGRAELVLALVAAVGTDLDQVARLLQAELQRVDYGCQVVRLSHLLRAVPGEPFQRLPRDGHLDRYITAYQDAGNQFRERAETGDALAALGIAEVQRRRSAAGRSTEPHSPQAFILRSLKHPEEAHVLRRVYGSSLYIVAAYSPEEIRLNALAQDIARSRGGRRDRFRAEAQRIMLRDESESDKPLGQHLQDTFPLADVFFDASEQSTLRSQVRRFVEIIFGHPFHTPTRDEFAMFHAQAAALRSSDLSRQVGASITTDDGDVVAVGTNEAPKSSNAADGRITGGMYWEGDAKDGRDFARGENTSADMRRVMLREVLNNLLSHGWLSSSRTHDSKEVADFETGVLTILKDTTLMSVSEFGRTVHAEMAALLDAARRGISVQQCTLYTTTFPCHNCAKHIVAAGVKRVVYIEPFPKSRATELHDDSIVVDSPGIVLGRVNFRAFVGIAPRRYVDCFTTVARKTEDEVVMEWRGAGATPRFAHFGPKPPYLAAETTAVRRLYEQLGLTNL